MPLIGKDNLPSEEAILLFHTLLIGASPLIPVPIVDEYLAAYLKRHMIGELAKKHNNSLSKIQIHQLAQDEFNGLSKGCSYILVFPLKDLFREVFFWLEWKRAIDLATQAYYTGYLVNAVLNSANFDPNLSLQYSECIETAKKGVNTKLLKRVIRNTFMSSRTIIKSLAKWLKQVGSFYSKRAYEASREKFLSRWKFRRTNHPGQTSTNAVEDELDTILDSHQPEIKELINEISENLRDGIGKIPEEHFLILRKSLQTALEGNGLKL